MTVCKDCRECQHGEGAIYERASTEKLRLMQVGGRDNQVEVSQSPKGMEEMANDQ